MWAFLMKNRNASGRVLFGMLFGFFLVGGIVGFPKFILVPLQEKTGRESTKNTKGGP